MRLQTIEGDTNSDYINGNYIDVCILKLSVSPPALMYTEWCICCKIGWHMLVHSSSKYINIHHRTAQGGYGNAFSQVSLFAGNTSVTFCAFLCYPRLLWTQKMLFPFCQQLGLFDTLKKSVCILIGQNSLIPNSMICHLLSSLHFQVAFKVVCSC